MKITRHIRSDMFDEICLEGSVLSKYAAEPELYRPLLERAERASRAFREVIGRRRIWHINSTAFGGGVAEMLPSHICLLREFGLDVRWLVFKPKQPGFFRFTKGVHNSLHDRSVAGLEDMLPDYLSESEAGTRDLVQIVDKDDLLIVHDPQPLCAAAGLLRSRPQPALWRCHIGHPERSQTVSRTWQMLSVFLSPFQRIVLSDAAYAFEAPQPMDFIQPSICPFSRKNRSYDEPVSAELGAAVRYASDEEQTAPGLGELLKSRYFLHVSRWDALKGIDRIINAFDRYVRAFSGANGGNLDDLRLVIAGPDPRGVADDPEGESYFEACRSMVAALHPDVRARVLLTCLSMEDADRNAEIVGRLQTNALAVFQLSQQEGFGLTSTEALFRGRPLVVSGAFGLRRQVTDGLNGNVIDDPMIEEKAAQIMRHLVVDPYLFEQTAYEGRKICIRSSTQIAKIPQWLQSMSKAVQSFERGSRVANRGMAL